MHASTTAALMSLVATLASAGTVYVDNLCPFPVWLNSNSDSPTAHNPPIPTRQLPANTVNAYHETLRGPDPNIVNNAIRVDVQGDLAHPILFDYHQVGPNNGDNSNLIFYDLNTNFGNPLLGQGYEVITNGGHPAIRCGANGVNPACSGVGQTQQIPTGFDFTWRLCASNIA
ncbi:MAG: hypothetical protein Q9162_002277 [Coniocarpon cinnabarinum]